MRNGRGFVQRRVDVTQPDPEDPKNDGNVSLEEAGEVVFTCVCSFKVPEPMRVERSRKAALEGRFPTVLAGREPKSWPEAPGIDSPL